MNAQMHMLSEPRDMRDKALTTLPLHTRMAALNPTVGDVAANHDLIAAAMSRAEDDGIELLLTPELALSGYPPEDLLLRSDFMAGVAGSLHDLIARSGAAAAVIGYPEVDEEGRLFNSLVVAQGGKAIAHYRKQHLPNYGVFDEKRYFHPGTEPGGLVTVNDHLVGLTICEDLWVRDDWIGHLRGFGAEMVVNISASPYHVGKIDQRRELVKTRADQLACPVAYCNMMGGQDELVFDGHCIVADPDEKLLAEMPPFLGESLDIGPQGGEHRDPLHPTEETYRALVTATRDYATKTGFKGALLGLSGGIDSALVLLVAVDALGAENVTAVIMPSRYSSDETQGDAQLLADAAGVRSMTLPIEDPFAAYLETLAPALAGTERDVTEENLQARIRGNLLMALSNKFGWLLLSTGNKSEWAVGYATLYGDMAGGFAVIRDAYKTQVFEMTKWRAGLGDIDVPASIIARPPSAELSPDQRDTDSLPPYEILDPILAAYLERNDSIADIVDQGFEETDVKRVVGLVDRAEYKRRQGPPGPKLTPRAFGRDRRMPIVNRFQP